MLEYYYQSKLFVCFIMSHVVQFFKISMTLTYVIIVNHFMYQDVRNMSQMLTYFFEILSNFDVGNVLVVVCILHFFYSPTSLKIIVSLFAQSVFV